jgi:hypothetical protein
MDFCLHHRVQIVSGACPTSITVRTGGSFPTIKRPEHEADHTPPTRAEVNNAWKLNSTPVHGVVFRNRNNTICRFSTNVPVQIYKVGNGIAYKLFKYKQCAGLFQSSSLDDVFTL